MILPVRVALVGLLMLASCKSCDEKEGRKPDAEIVDASTSSPRDVVVEPPPREASTQPTDAAAALIDEPFGEAGTSSCRLAYGPAEQPFRGPAAMLVVGQELRLIANDAGKPRVYPIPITPPPGKGANSVVPPRPASFVGMRWPPCEVAGRFAYCQGPGGPITRTTLGGNDTKTIAKSRSGTRIAAASLGPDHSVVGFLDTRRTTEGDVIQAFIAFDEKEAQRLSDDGAGATTLRFLQRGDAAAVAVYLDTRSAMVPIHARPVSLKGGNDLSLGTDSVVHVGGAPERGIDFAATSVGAKGLVLIPMPRDTTDFGMAAILVEDPVKDDVPAVWSKYPNGLDPAPIGMASARDGKSAWVVRTRPREKAVGSPRILELGRVDVATSTFTSYGEIALGSHVTDIALIEDGSGTVWILYSNATITWLERRVCG